MAQATDAQMQSFCDQYIRPLAELVRQADAELRDAENLIGDEYARAISASAWADARTDGPPHLLQSGNSANPDDVLNFNAFAAAWKTIIDGTDTGSDATNAATLRTNFAVLMRACVRPLV